MAHGDRVVIYITIGWPIHEVVLPFHLGLPRDVYINIKTFTILRYNRKLSKPINKSPRIAGGAMFRVLELGGIATVNMRSSCKFHSATVF